MFAHIPIFFLMTAFMVGSFALSIVLAMVRNRKRIQNMEAEAQALGFTFTAWNNAASIPKFETPFFRSGLHSYKNMMTGSYAGMEVQLFDFLHTSGSTSNSSTIVQTVAAYTRNVDLPVFALGPGGLAAKIIDALEHQNVEVTADKEFSRHHSVRGSDKERIKALFNDRVISFVKELDRGKAWQIEGAGKTLVIYRYARRVKPSELRDFLQETSSIAQSFFAYAGTTKPDAFAASPKL
jgi:hypothetical protein